MHAYAKMTLATIHLRLNFEFSRHGSELGHVKLELPIGIRPTLPDSVNWLHFHIVKSKKVRQCTAEM